MCAGFWVWIGSFVFKTLDELVNDRSDQGAGEWADPVDPMVVSKFVDDDGWTERAGWVEGTTCPEDT
jgi:hypothetical protein